MRYLTATEVRRFNQQFSDGSVLDENALHSAVGRPQQSAGGTDAYDDIHTKAAALFHSLTLNHAFVTANKRTAVVSLVAFYRINGYELEADDLDLYHLATDTAKLHSDVADIAVQLKNLVKAMPLDHVPTD